MSKSGGRQPSGNGGSSRKSGSSRPGADAVAKRTARKKELFLAHLADIGTVYRAAAAARVRTPTVYEWRKKDPDFAEKWEAVMSVAVETMESAFYERGKGWEEPVLTKKGDYVGDRKVYDTTAGIVWLKGHRPEKYRENLKLTGTIEFSFADAMGELRGVRRVATSRA